METPGSNSSASVRTLGGEEFLRRLQICPPDEDLPRAAGAGHPASPCVVTVQSHSMPEPRSRPQTISASPSSWTVRSGTGSVRLMRSGAGKPTPPLVRELRQAYAHACIMPVQALIGVVERTTWAPTAAKRAKAASACSVKSTAPGTTTGDVQSSSR